MGVDNMKPSIVGSLGFGRRAAAFSAKCAGLSGAADQNRFAFASRRSSRYRDPAGDGKNGRLSRQANHCGEQARSGRHHRGQVCPLGQT